MVFFNESIMNEIAVADYLNSVPELKAYSSAWAVLCGRFNGIRHVGVEFDFEAYIEAHIEETKQVTGIVTEELFIKWLMDLPILRKNVVSVEGEVWDLVMESFSDFRARSSLVYVTPLLRPSDKIQGFIEWVLSLCSWGAFSVVESPNHHIH